jgi:signal peptidase I
MPVLHLLAQSQEGGVQNFIDKLARTPLSQILILVLVCTVIRVALYPKLVKTAPHLRTGNYKIFRGFADFLDAIIYAAVFVFFFIRPFAIQTFKIPSGSMLPTLYLQDFIVANKWVYRFSDPKPGDIVVFRPPAYACMPGQIEADGQPNVDFIKRCVGAPGQVIEIRDSVLWVNGVKADDRYRWFTVDNSSPIGATRDGYLCDFKLIKYDGPKYRNWNGRYIPVIIDRAHGGIPNTSSITGNGGPSVSAEFMIGVTKSEGAVPKEFRSESEYTDEDRKVAEYLLSAPPAAIPNGQFLMMGDNRNGSFDGRAWGLVPSEDIVGRAEAVWLPLNRIHRVGPQTSGDTK